VEKIEISIFQSNNFEIYTLLKEIKKFVKDFKISNFTSEMKKRFTYSKVLFATLFVFVVDLAFGSFTGKTDDNKNKFSLKNLSTRNQVYSLSALRPSTFRYMGSLDLSQQNTGSQLQIRSMIRLERGNTTYVYPYKYTVKVPKFKTPTPPAIR
jgi:hypothetical protein